MSISGKFLSAKLNTTVIAGTHEWSCDETADKIEATTGADSGRGKKDVGVIDTTIRVVFYLDITTGIFTSFVAGTTLTALKLFADTAATSPLYSFSTAKIFSSKVRGQIRDKFVVECEIEPAGGTITRVEPN